MKQRYRVIVLDLDGTLTDSKKELSARNRNALIKAQQQGAIVVLASGRPTFGIEPIAQLLELKRYGGYILSFNGGVIKECSTDRVIYQNTLPESLIKPLYEESKSANCTILSYDGELIFAEQCDKQNKYVAHEAFLNKMGVRRCVSFMDEVREPLPKCLTVGDPELILSLERHLVNLYGEQMSIYRSEPFFLELVPLGIDKAQSLERLLQHINGDRNEMVAFGDGFNDLSMIEFAGCGVAMSNAQDQVKAKADEIALSNDEDGVAIWLEERVLVN